MADIFLGIKATDRAEDLISKWELWGTTPKQPLGKKPHSQGVVSTSNTLLPAKID